MNTMPLVSVIIPTYKRTWDYLKRAVFSILNQTYENIELIVVDDSPTSYENRAIIIEKMNTLIESNQKIKYIINENNIGGSLARNRGISVSTGKYVTFLDDDDEYLPQKIEHQVFFMEEQECDLSFEDMIMYNKNGDVVDVREYKDIKQYDNEYLLHYHLTHHMTGTPTFMFRRNKLVEINGFEDAKMGQEFYLMLKSIKSNLIIRYYPICDVKIYKHPDGGITSGKNKIIGELNLYNFKKKYFYLLDSGEKRFIKFRHYAVMVVAYLRNRMLLKAIVMGCIAFFVSPKDFLQQVSGYFFRIKKQGNSKKISAVKRNSDGNEE